MAHVVRKPVLVLDDLVKQSYPHQIEAARWLEDHPKAILADEMRLGKTRSAALCLLNHLPIMIICPASAKGVWKDELRDLEPQLSIDVAQGRSHSFNTRADALVINYDVLADHLSARRFPRRYRGCTLAVDECHRAKSTDAVRTRATQFFIEEAKRAVCLSGTPMPSRPAEFWPVLHSLGVIRMDQRAYERRYCAGWQAPWGWSARGATNLDELREMVGPSLLRRTKSQVFGRYIPYESRIITFDRPADERESAFAIEALTDHPNPIKSIAGLSEVVKESGLRKVPDAIEFIEDRLQESESGKVVVFFYHKEVGKALARGLAKYHPGFITGETSPARRVEIRKAFQDRSSSMAVAGGNILAAGEAVDFSVADTAIFVETSWVPGVIDQAAQRTESMGKLGRASTSYFLTLENSIDHHMLKKVLDKRANIDKVVTTTSREVPTVEQLLRF